MSSQERDEERTRGYEPPRVERVLDAAGLEREILYAGADGRSADEN
jgi:hypothetical protein